MKTGYTVLHTTLSLQSSFRQLIFSKVQMRISVTPKMVNACLSSNFNHKINK